VLGGGMRQAGYLAAACDYALDTNIDLLHHDHRRAKEIEATLKELPYVLEVLPVETNIVIFSVENPSDLVNYLKSKNILCSAIGPKEIRFVTHLQFTDQMLEVLIKSLLDWK